MRTEALRGAVYHETKRRKHTSQICGLFLSDWPHSCTLVFASAVQSGAGLLDDVHTGEDDSNGGEMRAWVDIGTGSVPGLAWLSLPELVMSPLPVHHVRAAGTDSRGLFFNFGVSFTNSHLNPLGLMKSSTKVEGRTKCAQSCKAWPRSGGPTERAGNAAGVALWMPKRRGPLAVPVWQTCLHLIENAVRMACQNRGDPKWGVPA